MPFARPDLKELITRISTDIGSRVTGSGGAVLRQSLLGIIGRALAGAAHMLYGYLDWTARQTMPDTAEKEHLERWAAIWKIFRKAAEFASGSLSVTAAAGAVVVAGTVFQRQDGIQYRALIDTASPGGVFPVSVIALVAGEMGNVEAGAAVYLLSPVAGVQSAAVVTTSIKSGSDVETDERLLARLLARIQAPPQGGAEDDYKQWALQVPGVTRVWVYPLQMGPGTVTVLFVCDDSVEVIPGPAKIVEVQAQLNKESPVTAEVFVAAPAPDSLDLTIALSPNTPAVRQAVTAELTDLLMRDSAPGVTILISRLREAVSLAAGESDNRIITPIADVTHATGHMARLGVINFVNL